MFVCLCWTFSSVKISHNISGKKGDKIAKSKERKIDISHFTLIN